MSDKRSPSPSNSIAAARAEVAANDQRAMVNAAAALTRTVNSTLPKLGDGGVGGAAPKLRLLARAQILPSISTNGAVSAVAARTALANSRVSIFAAAAARPSAARALAATQTAPVAGQSYPTSQHPHSLTYLAKVYRGIYSCNICHGSGSGFVYHCDPCSFDVHPTCFKLAKSAAAGGTPSVPAAIVIPSGPIVGQSYPTLLHPHPVVWTAKVYRGTYRCNVCKQGGSGACYHCDECGWDAHQKCFKPAPISKSIGADTPNSTSSSPTTYEFGSSYPSSLHTHSLMWKENVYGGNGFTCDVCKKGGSSPSFQCEKCSWDCHQLCFEKAIQNSSNASSHDATSSIKKSHTPAVNSTHNSSLHHHALRYQSTVYKGSYSCNKCQMYGSGVVYHCEQCGYDLVTLHSHTLTRIHWN
jgi:hypothetical protein